MKKLKDLIGQPDGFMDVFFNALVGHRRWVIEVLELNSKPSHMRITNNSNDAFWIIARGKFIEVCDQFDYVPFCNFLNKDDEGADYKEMNNVWRWGKNSEFQSALNAVLFSDELMDFLKENSPK
ncbi:MAG: hypothetical protein IT544_01615 [Rhodobacteraceae bacterium]|nr:hypothetical protein [Paracoccaceae bacterium]